MVPQQPTSPSPQPPSPSSSIRSLISTGEAPPASSASAWATTLKAKLRSRGVLILIGAIGIGVIGAKLFWPEPPKLKMAATSTSTPGPGKTTSKSHAVSETSKNKRDVRPTVAAKTRAADAEATEPATPPATSKAPAKPQRTKPVDARADAAHATRMRAAESTSAPTRVATAAAPKPATPTRSAAKKPAPPARPADPLGAIFIDEANGYSIRFPAGWAIRTFDGEPWVVDAGDGRLGLISIGFSPFPEGFTTESIPPEWIARRIKRRSDTTLHGQGYSQIGGRKALWSKSTGPLPMTHASPRMTRVNYIMPTGDGRVMELRVAAAPEQFNRLVPVMRRAVETFKLIPLSDAGPVAAAAAR